MLKAKHRIAIFLLNLLSKTWRLKSNGMHPTTQPAIISFWHGKMLPVWKFFEGANPFGVVSLSRDGEILSQLLGKWGFTLIRGSSSKNSKETLEEITNAAVNHFVLITPDGPRGPIRKFKPGAAVAAMRAGAPLYFCAPSIRRKKTLSKSWDKFEIPLPFSRIDLVFSSPIHIAQNAGREEISAIISEIEKKYQLSDVN